MADLLHGRTVLVVDDSPLIREELSETYRGLGLDVVGQAQDGSQALRRFAELRPDLVSMDIVMPEMHGIDCFRKLKELDPQLRLVFVSCLAFPHIIGQRFQEEIPPHMLVGKPVDRAALKACLVKLFSTPMPAPVGGATDHDSESKAKPAV